MRATFAALAVLTMATAGTIAGGLSLAAQAPASQWSGVYTAAQAGRGETLFRDKCSSCHAPDASGGDAPALKGSEFAVNWNDLSLGDLFDRIHVSMPMDAPGTLSNEQVAEILAFLLKSGNYPAGETDLPADIAKLKTVKFLEKDARK
jgi:mono/diheme cytochrome c family protein